MTITIASILTVMFFSYSIFAYRYARYSPWNATWQGITLLSQKITLASFVLFFIVDTLVPNSYPGRYSILVILLTLLAVEAVATLAGLVHFQKQDKHAEDSVGIGVMTDAHATLEPKEGRTMTNSNVTTDANGVPTLKPTGKVVAGIASSGALVVLVALLTAVNPELLDFAGEWKAVLYAGVVALAGFLGSYIKAPTGA